MNDAIAALGAFFGDVWRTLWMAVGLRSEAVVAARSGAHYAETVLVVAALAGAMRLLGQSAMLFINRVTKVRFAVTIGIETVLYVARLGIWAWVTWLCAGALFGAQRPFVDAAAAVLLGSAPFILGFIILIPHFGVLFAQVLRLWSFLVTVVMVGAVYQLAPVQAVVCAGLGWLAVQTLDEVTGRLLLFWRDVVWKRYIGPSSFVRPLRRLRVD